MELSTSQHYINHYNHHGLIIQPMSIPSSTPYNSHCTNEAFPHRHKLVISTHDYTTLYDECRCKPSQLTEDEWDPILRLRDEQLRDATIAIVEHANTVYNLNAILVAQRAKDGDMAIDYDRGGNGFLCEAYHVAKNYVYEYKSLSTRCDKKQIINRCYFLQTVATNTIIYLDDWRLMDMIRKPYLGLPLHGNTFLQITSTVRNVNKNRTNDLLKMTELSGRNIRPYQTYDRFIMQASPMEDDYTGIQQVSISCANVIKNILNDDNVDIMALRRYTFFDGWLAYCEGISYPKHPHAFFANERLEEWDMHSKTKSNQRYNRDRHLYNPDKSGDTLINMIAMNFNQYDW